MARQLLDTTVRAGAPPGQPSFAVVMMSLRMRPEAASSKERWPYLSHRSGWQRAASRRLRRRKDEQIVIPGGFVAGGTAGRDLHGNWRLQFDFGIDRRR